MLHIPYDEMKLPMAKEQHIDALISYIENKNDAYRRQLFDDVTGAMFYAKSYEETCVQNDWCWLEQFILADVATLKGLTTSPEMLQFNQFKKIYDNLFSKNPTVYVDRIRTYNSYSFVMNLGITVCPYCDKEYLDIVEQEGKPRRTVSVNSILI